MFAIFSLRRPNILPAGQQFPFPPIPLAERSFYTSGDLGVQRGLCRWYLSLHSDEHPITVSPEKKKTPAKSKSAKKGKKAESDQSGDGNGNDREASGSGDPAGTVTNIPPPFTPSVTKMLRIKPLSGSPPGLPDGLSVATLKSRISGKKVKWVQDT